MNGFAALDIPPCRRYVVVKATAGFAVCRLILKLLLFYSCLDFTQNLGKTQLTIQKDAQYDTYHYFKDYHRELQTVCANVDSILGNAQIQQREQQHTRKHEPSH